MGGSYFNYKVIHAVACIEFCDTWLSGSSCSTPPCRFFAHHPIHLPGIKTTYVAAWLYIHW